MWWRDDYPKSQRRQAKGGIKSQSKGSQFGKSWWAKRWIAVLDSFNLGARLSRGRSYARSGQVLSIDIESGQVDSKVQGSRPKPYDVTIQIKPLSKNDWKAVLEKLGAKAAFTARLLAGEMPTDIEEVFDEAKVSLFPKKASDLVTDCSCPDWSNPCKHVAAVYYLLGEEFDRDPFLIFKLRGMNRDELLKQIGVGAGAKPSAEPVVAETPEPISVDPALFWAGAGISEDIFGEVKPPAAAGAMLKRLGNFPFWRGQRTLLDALAPAYAAASQRALKVFLGEEESAKE